MRSSTIAVSIKSLLREGKPVRQIQQRPSMAALFK
jgi:hypothetical protein